ncbi:MAG TPA: O-antigen ligase family protein, partial [Verrucomicrobiota bacterium]|nr:O-antigen ligase family protein [Verrucomicrobiota bacterium]
PLAGREAGAGSLRVAAVTAGVEPGGGGPVGWGLRMDKDTADRGLEWLILGLVAGALGFAVLGFGAVRTQEWLVVQGLVALAAAIWAVRLWLNPAQRLLWPPVCWGVLLFTGFAVWRYTEAPVEYVARGELLRILTYATLFFVVVNNLHRQTTTLVVAGCLLALATALAFLAAYQFATTSDVVWGLGRGGQYGRRAGGSFVNPNSFAGFLALLIPLAAALAIAGRMQPVWRVLVVYALVAMLAALGMTLSRGGIAAAAVGLAFVFALLLFNRDYRWLAGAGLALLAAGALVGTVLINRDVALKRRVTDGLSTEQVIARNSRQAIWPATLAMWQDHRAWGVGPGHFQARFNQYRSEWVHGDPEHAHNDYLETLADWGAAGAAVIALPWLLLGWGVWRTCGQVKRAPADLEVRRSSKYAFVIGATGGLVALLAHGLLDFNFRIPANALVAVTWMGLLTGHMRFATDDWWVPSRWGWRLAATALIAALLAGLGWDLGRRGRENLHLARAVGLPGGSDEALRELRAAWAVEPRNPQTAYDLGESLRLRATLVTTGADADAEEAVTWFRRAAELNPYHRSNHLGLGRALALLDRHQEAAAAFQQALRVDPNGRVTSFYLGWHALSTGDYPAAWEWFIKSSRQGWPPYEPALTYLRLMQERGLNPQ